MEIHRPGDVVDPAIFTAFERGSAVVRECKGDSHASIGPIIGGPLVCNGHQFNTPSGKSFNIGRRRSCFEYDRLPENFLLCDQLTGFGFVARPTR